MLPRALSGYLKNKQSNARSAESTRTIRPVEAARSKPKLGSAGSLLLLPFVVFWGITGYSRLSRLAVFSRLTHMEFLFAFPGNPESQVLSECVVA